MELCGVRNGVDVLAGKTTGRFWFSFTPHSSSLPVPHLPLANPPFVWQVNALMRTLVCAAALAAFALVGCNNDFSRPHRGASGDDLVLRAHFIGSERLLKDKEASKLIEVWNLKSSATLRSDALNRFSRMPAAWMGSALPKGASDQANLFRPLLEDALANESFVEWRGSSFSLAAKLPEARAKAWDNNLRQVAGNWKLGNPAAFTANGDSGWEIAKTGGPSVRFTRAGDWTAVTVGPGAAAIQSNVVAKIKGLKPSGAWLQGDANLAQWKGRVPLLEHYSNLPVAHFALSNRADFVRTLVQFDFPKPHQWKSEPWQMPTNFIWDPVVDFTVARGIRGVLEAIPLVRNVGMNPVPNQICGWGNANLPYQFFYALPSRNVVGQLKKIGPKLPAELARVGGTNLTGQVVAGTNSLAWRGLPVTPVAGPMMDGKDEFLFLQLVPLTRMKQRPPGELYSQFMGRDDVVLYDYESTERRLPHIRQLFQIGEIATGRVLAPTNEPAVAWQLDIAPMLADSVTELRANSPTQMTLVRKSSIGLTSFELVALSRWIESKSFPAFGVYTTERPRTPPAKTRNKPGK